MEEQVIIAEIQLTSETAAHQRKINARIFCRFIHSALPFRNEHRFYGAAGRIGSLPQFQWESVSVESEEIRVILFVSCGRH